VLLIAVDAPGTTGFLTPAAASDVGSGDAASVFDALNLGADFVIGADDV